MDDRVGVAVIGAGYWGPNLVRNVAMCPETQLRWVCDLDVDRARRLAGTFAGATATQSIEQVLDDPTVDAVAIATPAGTHADLAIAALRAGKHVLVEKPLASTVGEAEKMLAVAAEEGRSIMCDHTYCYTPAVQYIKDLVDGGDLGEIHYVDSVRINLGIVQPDVDVIWDLAPHDLSILDFVLPSDRRVLSVAATGADPVGAGNLCVGYLTLALQGGAIAHVHVNWLSPTKVRTMIVGGSRRTLLWDDLNPAQRISIYDRGVDVDSGADLDARSRVQIAYRSGDMIAPALRDGEALGGVIRELARTVRTGEPAPTDGASGLRVLTILDAARRSLAAGGAAIALEPNVEM